jgi:hypothetical protein
MIENSIIDLPLDTAEPTNRDTLSANLARSITDEVVSQLPEEKREAERALDRTAMELAARGSDWADGRGQAIGSIPQRIYMRWAALLPGCWQDKQFKDEFLADNPRCCAPGYRPKAHGLRHGLTGIGAAFYQKNKHTVPFNGIPD